MINKRRASAASDKAEGEKEYDIRDVIYFTDMSDLCSVIYLVYLKTFGDVLQTVSSGI